MKTKLLPVLLLAFATNVFAADLPLDTPTEDFTINNDGTVLHKKTGLINVATLRGRANVGSRRRLL